MTTLAAPFTETTTKVSWTDYWECQKLANKLKAQPEPFVSDVFVTSAGDINKTKESRPWGFIIIETERSTASETQSFKKEQKSLKFITNNNATFEEEEGLVDWDACIKTPPAPRRWGKIKVKFKYVGRSKPIPIQDPWE